MPDKGGNVMEEFVIIDFYGEFFSGIFDDLTPLDGGI